MSIWAVLLILIIVFHIGIHDTISSVGNFVNKIFGKKDE